MVSTDQNAISREYFMCHLFVLNTKKASIHYRSKITRYLIFLSYFNPLTL